MASNIEIGFSRQRRNLIMVSIVLTFVEGAGIEIDKLNIFGNIINIANPEIVKFSLWVALLYWLARYYQYLRDLPQKHLRSSYLARLDDLVPLVGYRKEISKIDSTKLFPDLSGHLRFNLVDHKLYERGRSYYRVSLSIRAEISNENDSTSAQEQIDNNSVIVEGLDLTICRIRAALHVVVNTHLFTEYILPFMLPAVPATIWIVKTIRMPS